MRDEDRPSPESWLAAARAESERGQRGKLQIFFGAAPGVGKTYAMLEEAARRRAAGVDVVIGWVETHGRPATEALLGDLPRLSPRVVSYRGTQLAEFDLDGALARKPALLLVDELAHTNAPGSRHPKRWQDVVELLDAGIDVVTTVNVQHVESLVDVVRQITGVTVRETIPDRLIDEAHAVELVDLAPQDLLNRLRAGDVYRGDRADRALAGFFHVGNLVALRELALRRIAERVDLDVDAYKRDHAIGQAWPTAERLLVAIGPGPHNEELVRATYRMASRLHAPWMAVVVEPASREVSDEVTTRTTRALALAEQLGGETLVVRHDRIGDEIVRIARRRNVTRIVVGKPTHPRWRDRMKGSLIDAIVRQAEGIDVLVTAVNGPRAAERAARAPRPAWRPVDAVVGPVLVAAAAWAGHSLRGVLSSIDHAMLLLLAVILTSFVVPRLAATLTALLAVAVYDFFFVEPYYTLRVSDPGVVSTFVVMAVVGLAVSTLTTRVREAGHAARRGERRASTLHALARALASAKDMDEMALAVARHTKDLIGRDVAVWWREDSRIVCRAGDASGFVTPDREQTVAEWVATNGRRAGCGTDTLLAARGLYLPVVGRGGCLGVIGVDCGEPSVSLDAEHMQIVELFASQTGLVLDRARLGAQAEDARLTAETERTRTDLLAAVSHDLRTPLATIVGSADTVLSEVHDPKSRRLIEDIRDEGVRLGELVSGLLDLTRLSSGAIVVKKEWWPLREISDAVIGRLAPVLRGRAVDVRVEPGADEVLADGVLIGQVLDNLITNAVKYDPSDTPIEIVAWRPSADRYCVEVRDRGRGFPPDQLGKVFERFFRLPDGGRASGAGLGLAICAAIVRVHGGTIRAGARPDGVGAVMTVELPIEGSPPEMT